jgi:predicted NodU family carbamoyl transferase
VADPPSSDKRLTGTPTSLNENKPVVRTPDETVDTFLETHMDVLALRNYVVACNSSA